ncbi:MAG: 50S ribosomal protein L31 [Candidatus Saccharibacteria bacterium]
MKTGIHPEYIDTKVTCLGCNTTFDSKSTVKELNVDVCSNCHPFYTGKQKLVDTAGRVDRFKAKQKAADDKKEALVKKGQKALSRAEAKAMLEVDAEIREENTQPVKKDNAKKADQ